MKLKYFCLLFPLFFVCNAFAQNSVRIQGYVKDADNRAIDFVNVQVEGTGTGTTTDNKGYYQLTAGIKDSAVVVYSMIGYETVKRTITAGKSTYNLSVQMSDHSTTIDTVQVVGQRNRLDNVDTFILPGRQTFSNTTGSLESMLTVFTGVSSSNELSSQYNVRGGNFDENSVYVNGIEVYRPFLVRSGEQEGLSFINPDMVEGVSFSSGGFDAEYGDKMSSVLDIVYKRPQRFEASVSLGLLGASAYLGTGNKKFTQMHGFRYKTSAYLLGTLDTKAEYKPVSFDYQTFLTYRFNPKWELTFMGNLAQNNYTFIPTVRETTFGTSTVSRMLRIVFDGQEKDVFRTAFGALTLNYNPRSNLRLSLMASAFHSNENETYDISGNYTLNDVTIDMTTGQAALGDVMGLGLYHEHARNRLQSTVANVGHQGEYSAGQHKLKWGVSGQLEKISDKMREWEWRDSVGYSLPHYNGDRVELIYNLQSDNAISSLRMQAYAQDTYKWHANIGLFALTGGVRANFWTFNKEFLVSPRASLAYVPNWEKDFTFRFATGVYYQAPFYKEIRREVEDEYGNRTISLNDDIKAQRSLHFLLGGDHYFKLFDRNFKFTTEAYLKLADRMISYSVENVNIRYSGINDSRAYTAGIDFKLFGELLPGADSWINFSLMNSKEKIDGRADEWVSRPNEKRYSFSMLFQDYWPTNDKYKLNLRVIWNDGLPYTAPRNPDSRASFRSSAYRRIDIGASRGFVSGKDKIMARPFFKHIQSVWFNLDVFNLLNFNNEGSFYWITDANDYQWAAPDYLTKRQFNFRILVEFK